MAGESPTDTGSPERATRCYWVDTHCPCTVVEAPEAPSPAAEKEPGTPAVVATEAETFDRFKATSAVCQ